MSNYTDKELLQIIETGESESVEFKESLSGLEKRFVPLQTISPTTTNKVSFLSV